MHRQRSTIVFCILGVGCLGLVAGLLGLQTASAAPQAKSRANAAPIVVTVTAGKPSELAFKLSKSSLVAVGTVTFKVTNAGTLSHDFKICTKPATTTTPSSCVGKSTPLLKKGQSASLTVTLKKGTYEYLCSVPGHATAGMKGLVGIGVKLAATTTTTPVGVTSTPTSTSATTTSASSTTVPTGDPVAGATVFATAGCASCHTLKAAGATGTIGPNLDMLMPAQTLVYTTVTNGEAGAMPPFSGQLTVQQISNVAAYVYASTHGG